MSEEVEVVEEESQDVNPLALSDEEFMAQLSEDGFIQEEVEEETEVEEEDTEEETESTDEDEESSDEDSDDEDFDDDSEDDDSGQDDTDTGESTEEVETTEIDYKAEYEKLTAPFKANGKEMQVANIEDARALMQMGANYNKKMASLKPNLKLMKMLDNNGLLDESKLNYLIDLDKKNPDAIKKLIKDSNVDLVELDMDEEINYKPNTYNVNDKEVELDGILDEIKDTDSYAKTLDVISNKWDESSRKVLLENPNVIKVINEHVAMGFYDQIQTMVDSERMFGRLSGLSDIEAYKVVADQINAQGGIQAQPQSKSSEVKSESKTTKKVVDPKLKQKKKAASSTKGSKTVKKNPLDDINPLAMSDEDFEKIMDKYI